MRSSSMLSSNRVALQGVLVTVETTLCADWVVVKDSKEKTHICHVEFLEAITKKATSATDKG